MAKKEETYYIKQKKISVKFWLFGVIGFILLLVWLVILPLNFSMRLDIKKVIKTTKNHPKYKVTAYLPIEDSQISEVIGGTVNRSENKMNLKFNRGYGFSNFIVSEVVPVNITGEKINDKAGLDKLWSKDLKGKSNVSMVKITDNDFIVGAKALLDPLEYLTKGVKAKKIGKTEIDGKVNNWFRVTGLKEGRVDGLYKAIVTLTNDNFGRGTFVSYDVYIGVKNKLVNKIIINYDGKGVSKQIKLELGDYEK